MTSSLQNFTEPENLLGHFSKLLPQKYFGIFFSKFFQYFQLLLWIFPKLWSNFPRYIDGYFDLGKKGTNKQSQKNQSFRIRVKAFQLNSHSHYATTNLHVQKFSPSQKFFSSSFMIFTTKVIFLWWKFLSWNVHSSAVFLRSFW